MYNDSVGVDPALYNFVMSVYDDEIKKWNQEAKKLGQKIKVKVDQLARLEDEEYKERIEGFKKKWDIK